MLRNTFSRFTAIRIEHAAANNGLRILLLMVVASVRVQCLHVCVSYSLSFFSHMHTRTHTSRIRTSQLIHASAAKIACTNNDTLCVVQKAPM